jgi:hypothetical protein
VVIGYVFGTTEPAGEFAVREDRGPVPGRYRVEVRQDATRWASNSRDPVLRRMQESWRAKGGLTSEEAAEWLASARAKDFSPSLDGQRVFTRRGPDELTVEIRPGAENRLEIDVSSR